jgi:hypothetical protein
MPPKGSGPTPTKPKGGDTPANGGDKRARGAGVKQINNQDACVVDAQEREHKASSSSEGPQLVYNKDGYYFKLLVTFCSV